MNSEQNLTREEAIAILNTPDEQLNELIERAGALRKKYKGNHVSIHLLTNARSGNCSQNCAYAHNPVVPMQILKNINGSMMKNYMEITHLSMIINFPVIVSD